LLDYRLNRYEEAEQAYRRAVGLDPINLAWNNLGNLLQDYLNRYEESEQAYRRAIPRHRSSFLSEQEPTNVGGHSTKRFERHE
jgi:tetratricopeptide (TPR) repeat protein